ncbi:MAG TPA: phosphotransferase [Acidimicrobiales bacterium]|nr:phosphotransferase [Acidimicrobiales bacterium]
MQVGPMTGTGTDPADVAVRFALDGPVESIVPYGEGNINRTHLVTVAGPVRYLLQRLNPAVFPDPELLVANVAVVTGHLRSRLEDADAVDLDRRVVTLVPTGDGRMWWRASDGAVWRCVRFVERAHSAAVVASEAQAFEAGRVFGELHRLLVDLDPSRLGETIPEFHDPARRLSDLERVVKDDPAGRAAAVAEEISVVVEHRGLVADGRRLVAPDVPIRVAHNDAKLDNVLFDDESGRAVCVTDLDTIMPGSILWDIGDLLRTAACPASEDERDLDRVQLDLGLARAMLTGYREEAAGWITPDEVGLLWLAGAVLVYEQALRFLTDYVAGDVYFRTFRPEQNRDRSRVQVRLLASMLERMPSLEGVVADLWADA